MIKKIKTLLGNPQLKRFYFLALFYFLAASKLALAQATVGDPEPIKFTTLAGDNPIFRSVVEVNGIVEIFHYFLIGTVVVIAGGILLTVVPTAWSSTLARLKGSISEKKFSSAEFQEKINKILILILTPTAILAINPQAFSAEIIFKQLDILHEAKITQPANGDTHDGGARSIPVTGVFYNRLVFDNFGQNRLSENGALAILDDAGIDYGGRSHLCSSADVDGVARGCSWFGGTTEGAIKDVLKLKEMCACDFTITGGNERGHQEHNGWSFDLQGKTPSDQRALSHFITGTNDYVPGGRSSGDFITGGGRFLWHLGSGGTNHWHVDFFYCYSSDHGSVDACQPYRN